MSDAPLGGSAPSQGDQPGPAPPAQPALEAPRPAASENLDSVAAPPPAVAADEGVPTSGQPALYVADPQSLLDVPEHFASDPPLGAHTLSVADPPLGVHTLEVSDALPKQKVIAPPSEDVGTTTDPGMLFPVHANRLISRHRYSSPSGDEPPPEMTRSYPPPGAAVPPRVEDSAEEPPAIAIPPDSSNVVLGMPVFTPAGGRAPTYLVPMPPPPDPAADLGDAYALSEYSWRIGRTLRLIVAIDFALLMTLFLSLPWYFVLPLLPIPFVGFFGARQFQPQLLFAYGTLLPIAIAVRIYGAVLSISVDTTSFTIVIWCLAAAVVALQCHGMRWSFVGWWNLRKLSGDVRQLLRDEFVPLDTTMVCC